jgi:hypothetical protein
VRKIGEALGDSVPQLMAYISQRLPQSRLAKRVDPELHQVSLQGACAILEPYSAVDGQKQTIAGFVSCKVSRRLR